MFSKLKKFHISPVYWKKDSSTPVTKQVFGSDLKKLVIDIWWETPAAKSSEETLWFDSGWFGYQLSIWFSDPVKILEKVRGIFENIALKILTVRVNED